MPFICTVLGDIATEDLGNCYPHEHLIGQPPQGMATADLTLDSEAAAIQEMTWFRQAGGRALVEMTTPDYGRDAPTLVRISEATGVHIIAATGFNKEKFSAPFLEGKTVDELSSSFIHEVNVGMDGTEIRAGVIKASSMKDQISPLAQKLFRAASRAHLETGAPISTHTEAGTMALEQVALLTSLGVKPEHIIIGHIDRRLDWDFVQQLADKGVYIGFDQISKEKYYPDRLRVDFIQRLVESGNGSQILLSGDLARRSYWPAYGAGSGPGFTYILWRFTPWLREAGVPADLVDMILRKNPARALSFSDTP